MATETATEVIGHPLDDGERVVAWQGELAVTSFGRHVRMAGNDLVIEVVKGPAYNKEKIRGDKLDGGARLVDPRTAFDPDRPAQTIAKVHFEEALAREPREVRVETVILDKMDLPTLEAAEVDSVKASKVAAELDAKRAAGIGGQIAAALGRGSQAADSAKVAKASGGGTEEGKPEAATKPSADEAKASTKSDGPDKG